MSITKLIGVLAVSMMTLFAGAESARAGIVINFSGTVTDFFSDTVEPQPGGRPITVPGITDIIPGTSTFQGVLTWTNDPTLYNQHYDLYRPLPIITILVDYKYTFSSEMPTPTTAVPYYWGVEENAPYYSFQAGHETSHVIIGVAAFLDVMGSIIAPPDDPIEQRMVLNLGAFQSGRFTFSSRDFFTEAGGYFPNTNGHELELDGTVTSLSIRSTTPFVPPVSTPEPSTIVSAGVAGLVGLGLARRRRRAKVSA